MWFVLSQSLADGLDEDGIVRGDANAVRLQQVTFDFEVKGRRESTEKIVSSSSEVRVGRSEVQKSQI